MGGRESIFSLREALAGADDDSDLFKAMAEAFVTEGPKDLAEAQRALAARDGAALARSAHRLKGALLQFCAPMVLASAKELEALGTGGTFDAAAPVFVRLEQQLGQLFMALRETLVKGPDA
ncbi:MAG: Hpt domain-containing protein [Nitrospiraceae bacterium]|nr:Hpt domain-containing protein [Nitrospiraceae bacterium]